MVVFLQVGASMMDPNHFLMIVLSRFELFHIFSSADCRKRYREANKVSNGSTYIAKHWKWCCAIFLPSQCNVYRVVVTQTEMHALYADVTWKSFGYTWWYFFLYADCFINYSYNNRWSKFCLACSLIKGQSVCLTGCCAAEQHTGWRDVTPHYNGYR